MRDKTQKENGSHIHLFIENRPCLVVGGGRIALRKIKNLLRGKASVTVVSPEVCEELASLIHSGEVTHIHRVFEEADVDVAQLVYAATNSRGVNRIVLQACKARNVLCCCVDGNWSDGDFITPATIRHDNLMISVSSGGNNCRRSKMIKNSLARHLKMIDTASLVVVGTDHNHLNVEEREPYHLTGRRFEQAGFMIMQLWGIHEFMILNTCNRVEVIAVVSDETARNGILRHVMGFSSLKEDKYYLKTGEDAFDHLCLVAAGMSSQTPGENHITAQLKESLEQAKEREWAGSMIQEWISSALHVSKKIKNQVAPLLHSYEIEDLALKYLESTGVDLSKATVMMLGAGMIGKSLVKESTDKVKKIIWCYHKNRPDYAESEQVEICTFNDMKERITQADIIISATDSPGHILHGSHAPFFNQEKPVTLLDLGMPRNIDPALDTLSADITVVDLDGLKYWYRRELTDMDEILSQSIAVVNEHKNLYEKITHTFKSRDAAESAVSNSNE